MRAILTHTCVDPSRAVSVSFGSKQLPQCKRCSAAYIDKHMGYTSCVVIMQVERPAPRGAFDFVLNPNMQVVDYSSEEEGSSDEG